MMHHAYMHESLYLSRKIKLIQIKDLMYYDFNEIKL
jgi:hypothetical protein